MTKQLQVFNNEDFGEIRTAGTPENPLFCLADVCKALELDASAVMRRLEDGVISSHPIVDKLGRTQNANFVNEDGLYDVILDSRKPEAKKFRKWITSEVLPSIRKTGFYSIQTVAPVDKDFALYKVVRDVGKTAETLQQYFDVSKGISLATATAMIEDIFKLDLTPLKKLIPPAEHEIGTLTPTEIGKQIGTSSRKVNEKLVDKGLQIKDGKDYRLTDEGKKYAEAMPYQRNGHSGYQIKWTPKTITFLFENVIQ